MDNVNSSPSTEINKQLVDLQSANKQLKRKFLIQLCEKII